LDKGVSACFYPSKNIANRQDMPISDSTCHLDRFDAQAMEPGTYIKSPLLLNSFSAILTIEFTSTRSGTPLILALDPVPESVQFEQKQN